MIALDVAKRRSWTPPLIEDVLLGYLPELWARAECPLDAGAAEASRTAWQALCDVGVGGLLVPERCGGQAAGLLDAVAVAWRLSRMPAPLPFVSSAVLATRLAERVGATSLLTELATGDAVAAVTSGGVLRAVGDRWLLAGVLTDVLHGADAEHWIVCTPTARAATALALLSRPPADLLPDPDGTRPLARAVVQDAQVVHLGTVPNDELLDVMHQAELIRCAEALGAASFVLRHEQVAAPVLRAARTAVEQAAAELDVNGGPVAGLTQARAWTARVARLVRDTPCAGDRRAQLCAMRATGTSEWLPEA